MNYQWIDKKFGPMEVLTEAEKEKIGHRFDLNDGFWKRINEEEAKEAKEFRAWLTGLAYEQG